MRKSKVHSIRLWKKYFLFGDVIAPSKVLSEVALTTPSYVSDIMVLMDIVQWKYGHCKDFTCWMPKYYTRIRIQAALFTSVFIPTQGTKSSSRIYGTSLLTETMITCTQRWFSYALHFIRLPSCTNCSSNFHIIQPQNCVNSFVKLAWKQLTPIHSCISKKFPTYLSRSSAFATHQVASRSQLVMGMYDWTLDHILI